MQNNPTDKRRKRGKRGGTSAHNAALRDIHSKVRGAASHNLHGSSVTALVADAGKYRESCLIEERREDFIVPRQSLTRQQLLGALPQKIETEPVVTRQLDKQSGKMITTTDNRLVWKSDRTLLLPGNPFGALAPLKRTGSISVGLDTRKFTAAASPNETAKFHLRLVDGVWLCNTCDLPEDHCTCNPAPVLDDLPDIE